MKKIICLIILFMAVRLSAEIIYVTNGDAHKLQGIDLSTGTIVVDATTPSNGGNYYAIAVNDTIRLGSYSASTPVLEYDLNGNYLDSLSDQKLAGSYCVDGASSGTAFYSLDAFNSSAVIYSYDTAWGNAQSLFTVSGGSSFVGITYDSANGTLWISDQNNIYQYTTSGTFIGSFAHSGGSGCLAYSAVSDSLWYVPHTTTTDIQNYSKSGSLLGSVACTDRSGNIWGAEITSIPEPASAITVIIGGCLFGLIRWFYSRV